MPVQVEDLNRAAPNGLALKHLTNWHGSAMNRPALVQLLNRDL
jgi:hypothetical protein